MKVIIENLVAQVEGKEEQQFPEDTTIRFEINTTYSLSCSLTKHGLRIYKRRNDVHDKHKGSEEDRIRIIDISSLDATDTLLIF